ncbi:vitellin-degrading protease [Drosophila grimshawi]|uniref:trypsin n=1 Tax=Drosophila grimshawi TaxID=7222 RepID=B4JIV4_DROGR|nr:vitellin-degrading protease [Drosophila grimshawi]EDV99518.1 GH12386 [Drosophila grimshawi]
MQRQLWGASLLLLLIGLAIAGEVAPQGRIWGGEEALADAAPYAASLRIDNVHMCGASILSETQLLTAAHCCYRNGKLIDPSRITCRVGSTNQYAGGRIVSVASITSHPDYDKLDNNLAIITLTTPLVFTDRIKVIELVDKNDPLPAEGTVISVFGWGHTVDGTSSFKIRQLNLKLATDAACQDAYSEHDATKSVCLTHTLKEGTCYGDGGGAAVYQGKLLGVSNFVVGACGSRYPDVFVRTAGFSDWLQQQLQH